MTAARLDVFRLASIFIRFRLRSMRNAFRARAGARPTRVATLFGVVVAFLYVGLFAQSFSIVATTVDLTGQLAVLALVTGTIAFGSLAARAASSEAVRAGSPENEFLLARPVSLHTLVAARGLADAVTDPVGGLFLLPVLIAVTIVWQLGAVAWPIAIAISLLVQIGISTLAYAVQLAIVRYVPGRRRRLAWTALRLLAALSLATLWMLGTYVLRAPAELATRVAALAPALAFSPSMLAGAPLGALARGETGQAVVAIAALAGGVAVAMLLTIAIAKRAGMSGWEEAGAVWAEATAVPPPTARLPTAATKDLRLIVRDRSQLLALIAMPAIFIGVQIFGAAGWAWTTANLGRISCFAYSLALYMCTIGPLTHMQAERRAFWILRTVPVPLARLMAAKARAWAIIIGAIAAVTFTALSLSVPDVSVGARVGAGLLVTAGAAGMSFVAVAMACGGADLSDETGTAVGPATIYAFLFVGGLFNIVLLEDAATRIATLVLYACAGWAYWQAGIERAAICLDAEAVRARRLRAADGATMVIVYAVGGRALVSAGKSLGRSGFEVAMVLRGALLLLVAVAAAIYLARRVRVGVGSASGIEKEPRLLGRPVASLLLPLAGAAVAAGVRQVTLGPHETLPAAVAAVVAVALLGEELIFRGVLQRAIQEHLHARGLAAVVSSLVSLAAAQLSGFSSSELAAIIAVHAAAAGVYALTGRVAAAWLARALVVGVAAFV